MAKSMLYEFVLLYHPKDKKNPTTGEVLESKKTILINDKIGFVLATEEKQAAIMVARQIPAEYEDKLEDVQILIRPFA